MKATASEVRILVATDCVEDGKQILHQLEGDFHDVRLSTDPARTAQDFEECKPDVLVLAFDSLDKAQRYYLGLYRLSPSLPQDGHRTVILCDKDELREVVDLCKKEYFDDYVLYWPQSHDGSRLAMSIRIACREMAAVRAGGTRPVELLAQARHVDELDRILGEEFADTEQQAAGARRILANSERDIARTIDEFSGRLGAASSPDGVDLRDGDALARDIGQLKDQTIALARQSSALGVESANARARSLKDKLEPSLAGARALAEGLRRIRPVVMVVEDDEFARQLVGRTLDPESWEAVFANDGTEALSYLRRMRPDIILMDIRLPGMDGVSLTQRLKASPHLAGIPVIMMTGDARKETLASSMAAGAAAFVVKPFTRELLTAKLEKALAR
jgi:CheY-like chemotaxis protein